MTTTEFEQHVKDHADDNLDLLDGRRAAKFKQVV